MQKRKMYWLCGVTLLLLGGSITALGAVLKHEPSFYRHNQIDAGGARKDLASTFLREFGQMTLNIKAKVPDWGCEVSEAQMNCFFEEAFAQLGEAEALRKLNISSPNVTLENDNRVRLAFRYGSGWFSSIISYDLKIWLVPREPNMIAVEILKARAGALPISSHAILQQLCEFGHQQNYKVTLYRHEGNSVAVVELQPYQPHPWAIMTRLKVDQGKLTIRGKTLEHALAPPVVHIAPLPK
jgi:hypothetical protein